METEKVVKPVCRVKATKKELAKRRAVRNAAYYDVNFERLRQKALVRYYRIQAELKAAQAAAAAEAAEVGKVEAENSA